MRLSGAIPVFVFTLLGVSTALHAGLVFDHSDVLPVPPGSVVVQPGQTSSDSKTDPKPDPTISPTPTSASLKTDSEVSGTTAFTPAPETSTVSHESLPLPLATSLVSESQVQSVSLEKSNNSVPEPSSLLALGVLCPLLLRRRRTV